MPVCLLLAGLTVAAFWPVWENDFIVCDDPDYITQNQHVLQGLSRDGFRWAMTSMEASNWHPVTWLSHMLDVSLFGVHPGSHHAMSVGIHALNAVILFLLLQIISGARFRSAVVAALFALHPLHVESVAWASERKDVLSMLFGLLSLFAYVMYASGKDRIEVTSSKRKVWYGAALLLFAVGLMAKPMLVSWPLILFLLDYWPLKRFGLSSLNSQLPNLKCLIAEKIPFVVLSAFSCVMTLLAQHKGGAMVSIVIVPLLTRFGNAVVSYVNYLLVTILPTDLAPYYPHGGMHPGAMIVGALLFILVLSGIALWQAGRRPYILVGWLWYLITLVPVIGVVQVGLQSMADRYTYIPLVGIFILVVWFVEDVCAGGRFRRIVLHVVWMMLIGGCFFLTNLQVQRWKDSVSLYSYTLRVTENNYIAHMNLGSALLLAGRVEEAGENFVEAVRIQPEYAEAVSNLGFVRSLQGRPLEAEILYRRALTLKPELTKINILLGSLLEAQGRPADAVREYRMALKDHSGNVTLLNNLAWLLASCPDDQVRSGSEAVEFGEMACQLVGYKEPLCLGTLAAAYAEVGRFDDAIRSAEKARDLAAVRGSNEVVQRNEELLRLYRAGKPFRETIK